MSRSTFAKRSGAQETRESWKDASYETKLMKRKALGNPRERKKKYIKEAILSFQLYRGDDKYPRTKEMTLEEMVVENKRLTLEYARSHELGLNRPLWTWKVIG